MAVGDNIPGIMKKLLNQCCRLQKRRLLVIMAVTWACVWSCFSAEHLLDVGARYHNEHSEFLKLPFGTGDISYVLAYSYAESHALWQLGVDLAPDLSGEMTFAAGRVVEDPNFAVTPHLNLIIKDNCFRGGLGVRTTYIKTDDDDEWLDPYWQFMLGLNFPVMRRFALDVSANYVFDLWSDLDKFDFGDLDYQLSLNMRF